MAECKLIPIEKTTPTAEQIAAAINSAKYKVGDVVTYTNEYGVNLGGKTITGITSWHGTDVRYFIAPKDSYWAPVLEERISAIGGAKS